MASASLIPMRLYPASPRSEAAERAASIVERLQSYRPLSGGASGWQVLYRAAGISEAMAMCAADLDDIDPTWAEVLDFEALPAFPQAGHDAQRRES